MHKGSLRAEIKWTAPVRRATAAWYRLARRWNSESRRSRSEPGILGSSALRVLECLIFDFVNYTTGRLDPSYERIADVTGLARSTVAAALDKLRRLNIINWVRRCEGENTENGWRLRQITNAYQIEPPSSWIGAPPDPNEPPAPHRETLGLTQARQSVFEIAASAPKTPDATKQQIAALSQESNDPLARALAELGRLILTSENRTETGLQVKNE